MTTLMHLPYLAPWSWSQFHQHFALRLLPGIESLDSGCYSRTVRVGSSVGWISVRPLPGQYALELTLSDSLQEHASVLASRVRKMFDLDTDPATVARHFADDPLLGPIVATNPELRLPSAFDPFEQAVRAIIGQQVTVKAAVTITRRLVDRLGEQLPSTPANEAAGLLRLFPSAEAVANAVLDNIGMPGKRVATLQRLAAAVADDALELHVENGADELIKRLCELPGIGPWTAEYIALRGFGEPDAFPAADLGLLKAPLWGNEGITARQLLARSQAWRPWRAYAAVHIWQNYSNVVTETRQVKAVESSPIHLVGP
ncbi:DNA-3-methyladenine glycosylase [Pseudomonas stutzeri]|uniref:DNA-3-methyladenine glycosylase family protein n=1 Tax=Stutzerimonas stutzeri TaxID=316 RepID=UPI002109567E|nr:DNA-3-methyladenine glycosylase [Stutzerimonas stutzeri]MCQ4310798.1 DNA-3-methyladenine glycosylase [Stutzerimonas stutzeri]